MIEESRVTEPSSVEPCRRRSRFTPSRLADLLKDDDPAFGILESVCGRFGPPPSLREACHNLDRLIDAALNAVGQDLARHPRISTLRQLIEDDRELTDEEVGCVLELIYSHMVNRFKGDLAEILAIGACSEYLHAAVDSGRIPECARASIC